MEWLGKHSLRTWYLNKALNEMRELVMRRLGEKHSGQREEMARAEALQMDWDGWVEGQARRSVWGEQNVVERQG